MSTSFEVPAKVRVSEPIVTVSFEPLSAAIVREDEIAAVVAEVTRPFASIVRTGIAVAEP